ncbi:PfkB family carbohydrate kinase [Mitsuaria sp. GD03876]|uniref:PfkB family carbohydrate kinase n=1 Tax=Mitsuaria sp. GD03876 TaxID=2975399 RepID=UPI002446B271|nr:PfkB family carbohydrate kinase [Mitsuaria sp. GD03876]MDH0866917.1 PfkB family carbohydrate kinase [Mitsuaria sp. GD03876]
MAFAPFPVDAPSGGRSIQAAVAGEALIDLIRQPDGRYLPCHGGALFNLSRALSRQGVGTHYLNPLSSDRFGRELARRLTADGVRLSAPEPVQAPTSLAMVDVDAQGHPQYAFYRDGVADRGVDADGLTRHCDALPELRLVCTGALALDARDTDRYLPWLRVQRLLRRCVVVDANLRPSVMPDLDAYRASVQRALALADIVKVSDEDLQHLGVPGDDALARCGRVLDAHPQISLIALTLGAEGAWLLHRNGIHCFAKESRRLTVVDTVGAGDSFLAGLLAHLLCQAQMARAANLVAVLANLLHHSCDQALRHALGSASLCVQASGAAAPTWQEVRDWVAADERRIA